MGQSIRIVRANGSKFGEVAPNGSRVIVLFGCSHSKIEIRVGRFGVFGRNFAEQCSTFGVMFLVVCSNTFLKIGSVDNRKSIGAHCSAVLLCQSRDRQSKQEGQYPEACYDVDVSQKVIVY